MPKFNGDITFVDGSGQMIATTGSLTLRADGTASGSVIVGDSASLRPERDAVQRLGTPGLRWYDGWIGNLNSLSGTLGGPTQTFSWSNGGFGFIAADVSYASSLITIGSTTTMAIEAASELTSDGTVRFNDVSQFEMSTLMEPAIDNVGTIGQTAKRYSRIHASSGIFNALSPQASGTYISVDGSLIPTNDSTYTLGTLGNRWGSVVASSGRFNSIYAQASGEIVSGNTGEWIELGASLIPPTHPGDGGVFWLGSNKFNQFAGIRAASGVFGSVSATIGTLTTLTTTVLNINVSADFINLGGLDWDLGGAQTLVSNGDWVFDTDATLSATTGTITTATIPTLGSTTLTANTINCMTAFNAFGSFGTLGLAIFNGGAFFGAAGAPTNSSVTPFGLEGFKWGTIYSVSGIIDSLLPATSGGTMMMHGHIDPGNDSVFDLGTTARKWSAVHAVSGVFDSGVRSDQGLAQYFLSIPTGSISISAPVTLPFNETTTQDSSHYSSSAGVVTIGKDGLYKLTYSTNYAETVSNNRIIGSGHIIRNSTVLSPSRGTMYVRDNISAESTITKSFLTNLNDSDTIAVQGGIYKALVGGSARLQFQPGSSLTIEYIRPL